ncbi:hypothetical protein GCM10007415_34710 [Parapedobacter pyrenivorans]|uniref:Signal transduction histidine kinase internal region domain-containing protein n=1 Tax=Parapedobacter pyrenivorans TaxID=1305674 RepID=A0A917HYX5_9SPHI|nr:histidine kinase [Parapedobacter pyrenivorans]GGG96560.1 hypothetical protein GCM10007415_34710 [Parapedobacter pyrenivorans]
MITLNTVYNLKMREEVNIVNVLAYTALSLVVIYILMGNFFLIFSRTTWVWGLLLMGVVVYAIIKVNHKLIYDIFPSSLKVIPNRQTDRTLEEFIIMAIPRLYYYTIIALFLVAAHRLSAALINMFKTTREKLEVDIARLEAEKRAQEMELRALGGHFNPHFQYNELNGIEDELLALMGEQGKPLGRRIQSLADILKYNAENVLENRAIVVIEKELGLLDLYLNARDNGRTDLKQPVLQIIGESAGEKIVAMTLIYLAENAYTHGRFDTEPLTIIIDFKDDYFSVCFRNQIGRKNTNQSASGGGLAVVRRRLELAFDDRYALDTRVDGDFFEVTLTIHQML